MKARKAVKKVVTRKFVANDEKMVKKISDALYGAAIAYKVSFKTYPLTKQYKIIFTTEPISDEVRESIVMKIAK